MRALRIYNGSVQGNFEYNLRECYLDGDRMGTYKDNITWHGNTLIKVSDGIFYILLEGSKEIIIDKEEAIKLTVEFNQRRELRGWKPMSEFGHLTNSCYKNIVKSS